MTRTKQEKMTGVAGSGFGFICNVFLTAKEKKNIYIYVKGFQQNMNSPTLKSEHWFYSLTVTTA